MAAICSFWPDAKQCPGPRPRAGMRGGPAVSRLDKTRVFHVGDERVCLMANSRVSTVKLVRQLAQKRVLTVLRSGICRLVAILAHGKEGFRCVEFIRNAV